MEFFSLIFFKITAALIIFTLTLLSGLLPIKFSKHHVHIFCIGNAFASGVFLSAALLHLLPEAIAGFNDSINTTYPLAQLILVTTFFILLILERAVAFYGKSNTNLTPWLLVMVLTIHSIIEGATIGINGNSINTAVIFFAIIAHKGSEGFALASSLHHYLFSPKQISKIIGFFSLMTPIGVLTASLFSHNMYANSGNILEPIITSIAAGTFLYIGTEHMVEGAENYEGFGQIFAVVVGIALMAVVAIWV